jgi:hypothetical protein
MYMLTNYETLQKNLSMIIHTFLFYGKREGQNGMNQCDIVIHSIHIPNQARQTRDIGPENPSQSRHVHV